MKKFGALLMTGIMACSMAVGLAFSAGCNTAEMPDFEMPEGGYDGNPVEIMFYNTMGQNLDKVLSSAITRFNDRYPNITVKYDRTSGDYDTLRDKIAVEISGGKQPNLAYCYPDHVALYNQSNSLVSLDGFLPGGDYNTPDLVDPRVDKQGEILGLTQEQVNGFVPEFLKEGSAFEDGKTYSLPFAKSTEVLYYNVDFFAAHPEIPTPTASMTWDDIFEICAAIKEIDSQCTPLGIDSESNLFITLCEQYGSPYTSSIGEHFLFNNDINKGFVQKFYDWFQAGYFTTETVNKAYTSNLFKEQKSFMSIGSSAGATYQAPTLTDGKAEFQVGIVPIPQVHPEQPKTILQGPSICIFKSQNPQQVIASWLFLKFITTDIAFQAQFSETSGYIPVQNAVFSNEAYMEFLNSANGNQTGITALSAQVGKKLVEDQAFYISPAFMGSSKARDEVGTLMVAVLQNKKTIDKAFQDAIEECEFFVGSN